VGIKWNGRWLMLDDLFRNIGREFICGEFEGVKLSRYAMGEYLP